MGVSCYKGRTIWDGERVRVHRLTRKSIFVSIKAFDLLFVIAYVDPGQGSILLQIIIAGVAGLAFYFALARKRIVGFFKRIFGNRDKNNEAR